MTWGPCVTPDESFTAAYPSAERLGASRSGVVPPTLVADLSPDDDGPAFREESFCAFTVETSLGGADAGEFLAAAVDFCNDKVWGSLNAGIIVHPKSLKDPRVKAAVDRAIANLRAGSIGVNHWAALAYGFVSPTWGAFPGHDIYDIRSGKGVVHNTYLFDKPQKSVIRGPFRVSPRPVWFVDHKTAAEVGRKVTYFNADPSLGRIPSLLWSAIRG